MMKKFFGILFLLMLSFVFATSAWAASDTTLHFSLTCDGKREVYKRTGDVITVTFALENRTDQAAGYPISTLVNEVYYDHLFFELVEDSARVEDGLSLTTREAVYSWGEHRMYFNGFQIPAKQYAARQVIGSFQLKIIATEGTSSIRSVNMLASGSGPYTVSSADLHITIGDPPPSPVYELVFETNGGSELPKASYDAGTVIDLSGYIPVKENFTFDGWYSDAAFTHRIEYIELNGNSSVYAKWVEKTPEPPVIDPPPGTEGDPEEDPPVTPPEEGALPSELSRLWWLLPVGVATVFLLILRKRYHDD